MSHSTVREMISSEAVQKKFISPKAVFVYRLCVAGHLIKRTSFQILASVRAR